jgi:hypothetical protein
MLLKKLLRRTTVVALLVLVQLAVLVVTALRLSNHYLYVSLAFSLVSVAVAFAVVSRRDNPSYKLAWILLVLGFPVLGGLLYLLFGGHRVSKKLKGKIELAYTPADGQLDQKQATVEYMENRESFVKSKEMKPLFPITGLEVTAAVACPIIASGDISGCVIFLESEDKMNLTDTEIKLAQVAAAFLGKQMEE